MKTKLLLVSIFIALSFSGMSQFLSEFSVGVAGNYTQYLGEFLQGAPGAKIELGYGLSEDFGYSLSFTRSAQLKTKSEAYTNSGSGVKTHYFSHFNTLSGGGRFTFRDEDDKFRFFVPLTISFILVKYEERTDEPRPSGSSYVFLDSGIETGLTFGSGIGVSYKLGLPVIFAETGFAIPANVVGGQEVENNIPIHATVNVGVRFSFAK